MAPAMGQAIARPPLKRNEPKPAQSRPNEGYISTVLNKIPPSLPSSPERLP
jgi:hypothetical protein